MNTETPSLWLYRYIRDYRACKTLHDLCQLGDQDLFDWEPELGEEWARCYDRLAVRELLVGSGAL